MRGFGRRVGLVVAGALALVLAAGPAFAPRVDRNIDGMYVCVQFPEQPTLCH